MPKKKKQEEEEEHVDETWLVPYSDLLTLLLALFIVLFAMSQINQKKFEQMSQSFSIAFNAQPGVLDEQTTVQSITESPPEAPKPPKEIHKYDAETMQLMELKKQLDKYISKNKLNGQIKTKLTGEGLVLNIKDALFFLSGSANLVPESESIAKNIAGLLTTISQKVVVSGHTDNVPINTPEFPSNWDLSSKRAVNFMKYMMRQESLLRPDRFSAVGYGEYRPEADNATEEGRQKNRRVEVMIMRNFPLIQPMPE